MTGRGKGLTYHAGRMEVRLNGTVLHVTPTERAILAALIDAHGDVVTCSACAVAAGHVQVDRLETRDWLRAHLRNIRRRLGSHADVLINVRTCGYRLAIEGEIDAVFDYERNAQNAVGK